MGKETADEMRNAVGKAPTEEKQAKPAPADLTAYRQLPQYFSNGVDVLKGEGDTDLWVIKDFAGVPVMTIIMPVRAINQLLEQYDNK